MPLGRLILAGVCLVVWAGPAGAQSIRKSCTEIWGTDATQVRRCVRHHRDARDQFQDWQLTGDQGIAQ
ncbi:MAG: hypothetical protein GWO19_27620, partial [Nitrospinaceae bacterium]|nr:hypothetical protein [Nitrospinaceae bacterium]NIS88271.1 hypothetical protein [Nitrospinaceae bacterium]